MVDNDFRLDVFKAALGLSDWPSVAPVLPVVSDDQHTADAGCQVFKMAEEKRFTLGVAYPANKPDVSKAADGHRDFISPESLEQTAWEYMESRQVGIGHVDGTEGHGTVVESYIYRGPDWDIPTASGSQVIKAGDWLLGVRWDEQAWAEIKAGRLDGFSPQGLARRSAASPEQLQQLRKK
jgi:hypothetical protein